MGGLIRKTMTRFSGCFAALKPGRGGGLGSGHAAPDFGGGEGSVGYAAARWAGLLLLAAMAGHLAGALRAQPRQRVYCVTHAQTLVAEATAVTIQQPATGAENVRGKSATVYASAACGVTIEKNGTAATETALTAWVGRDDIPQTPKATAWGDSDVGAGDPGPHHVIPAGVSLPLALWDIELRGNGTGKNFTLRTDSCSADVEINLCWEEF